MAFTLKAGIFQKCFICEKYVFRLSRRSLRSLVSTKGLVWGSAIGNHDANRHRNVNTKTYSVSSASIHQRQKVNDKTNSSRVYSIDKVVVSSDSNQLVINWKDGKQSLFHSIWLRHNCHCEECKHKESGQKLLKVAYVPSDIQLCKATVEGTSLCLTWEGLGEHEGRIPVSFLYDNDYSTEALNQKWQESKVDEKCWADAIPEMECDEVINSDKSLLKFLTTINIYGLCLLTNSSTEENKAVQVAERIWPKVQNTMYGDVFDVKVTSDAINVAYSSSQIDYHMDLVYYESPPGLQLLHCIRFDDCVTGGENKFLDMFRVAEEFRKTHPKSFETLVQIPATFQKIHYDRELPVELIREQSHIVLNRTQEVVQINWAPAFEAPLAVGMNEVERYYKAYTEFAKTIEDSPFSLKKRLKVGEIIVFNNRRMVHLRNKFELNGGDRFLKGTYVNIDHYKIRLQTLSRLIGDGRLVKRVGNGV